MEVVKEKEHPEGVEYEKKWNEERKPCFHI